MQTRPYRASPGLVIAAPVACIASTACLTTGSGSHHDETADFSACSSWSRIADDPNIREKPGDVKKRGVARPFETFPRSSEYVNADF